MNKCELLKLAPPEITAEMKEFARKDILMMCRPGNSLTYQYGRYYRVKTEGKYLLVSIFLTDQLKKGNERPKYILFIEKDADSFLTYIPEIGTWSNAMLVNLDWPEYALGSETYISQEDLEMCRKYLDISDITGLREYQYQARERQLIKRYKKITDPWDEIMKSVPNVPKDWIKWVTKSGIREHYIFYEYQKGGAKEGYCTHCGRNVRIQSPKYNKKGTCSSCGYPIQYKSIGRFSSLFTEWHVVYLCQRTKNGGIVFRRFMAYACYRREKYRVPEISIREAKRTFYDHKLNNERYYYGEFKQRECRWIKDSYASAYDYCYCGAKGMVYPRTFYDLNKHELKYTGLLHMVRKCGYMDPTKYLYRLSVIPVLEQVVKAGLYKLANEIYDEWKSPEFSNEQKGGLAKILGIDKQRLKRLRVLNGGTDILNWLQIEKQLNINLSDDLICWYIKNGQSPNNFHFLLDRMSFVQIKNYLVRQQKENQEEIGDIVNTWKDYLSMADRLHMDVYDEIVYRPTGLYKRHEEAVRSIEKLELSVTVAELLEKYPLTNQVISGLQEKYGFQDNTYTILAPKNIEDILKEGRDLHHCIDKKEEYFERINQKETYILFLRKTEQPDKPYYTLEIEPGGVIRQKRTEYNRQKKDIEKAKAFLKSWQLEIQKRLTKEDKQLADWSRRLRLDTYKQVRMKQVTIHGGLYEGQLLADVLEADLMDVPQEGYVAA